MTAINAPWTNEQVESLRLWQESPYYHPFTCPSNIHFQDQLLIPTNNGWVCDGCEYTQDWAHDYMLNDSSQFFGSTWLKYQKAKW